MVSLEEGESFLCPKQRQNDYDFKIFKFYDNNYEIDYIYKKKII